jgi:chitosanase
VDVNTKQFFRTDPTNKHEVPPVSFKRVQLGEVQGPGVRYLTCALLTTLMVGICPAQTPHEKALDIANQEWARFGHQTIDANGKMVKKGGQENEQDYYMRVADYWKQGVDRDLTGKDQHEPWSAAFISWVMKEAGMGDTFSYSDWHATYIRNSILARRANDPNFAYWGYRLSERAPQVGDLVGYARQGGIEYDYQPTVYSSHTDLVVAVRPGEIDVIGGNVKDSVSKKTLTTDAEGKLVDKQYRWFVVMAPSPR